MRWAGRGVGGERRALSERSSTLLLSHSPLNAFLLTSPPLNHEVLSAVSSLTLCCCVRFFLRVCMWGVCVCRGACVRRRCLCVLWARGAARRHVGDASPAGEKRERSKQRAPSCRVCVHEKIAQRSQRAARARARGTHTRAKTHTLVKSWQSSITASSLLFGALHAAYTSVCVLPTPATVVESSIT